MLGITHTNGFKSGKTYALRFAFLLKSPEKPLKSTLAKLLPKVEQKIHLYSLSGAENIRHHLIREAGVLTTPIDLFRTSEDGSNVLPTCQLFVYVPAKWKLKSNLHSAHGAYDVLCNPYSRKKMENPYVGYRWDMHKHPRFESSNQIKPTNYPPLRVSMEKFSLDLILNFSVIFFALSAFCFGLLKLSPINSILVGAIASLLYAVYKRSTAIELD